MSNVLAFPRSTVRRPSKPCADCAKGPALFEGTFCATLVFEGLDDPAAALEKAADLIDTMPFGPAREQAEHELHRLRATLNIS